HPAPEPWALAASGDRALDGLVEQGRDLVDLAGVGDLPLGPAHAADDGGGRDAVAHEPADPPALQPLDLLEGERHRHGRAAGLGDDEGPRPRVAIALDKPERPAPGNADPGHLLAQSLDPGEPVARELDQGRAALIQPGDELP